MMQIKTLAHRPPLISPQKPNFKHYYSQSPLHLLTLRTHSSIFPSSVHLSAPKYRRNRFMRNCINSNHDVVYNDQEIERENDSKIASVSSFQEGEETEVEVKREALENQTMWNQMREIVMFTGPATGLWLCGPLMSLIDTAVIGQGSSIELAALGPGTVVCDYMSYVFMFLSVATSNLVATSLARRHSQDQKMFILYLQQIHMFSLGMKDSWGPLKALAVSSIFNFVGDVVLCSFLGYGIAGAAWATMVSQVVAAYMMIEALNKKGYNAFAFSVPTLDEILTIVRLAAPVFVTMMSKVVFYSLLIYFATSMGTYSVAAHQVMLQTYSMCTVWGEPLSQTAQSFMPELIYGFNRSLEKARMLQKSLVIIGATLGLVLGVIGTSVPWLCPNLFTPDENVIREMHKVLLPYFMALAITPSTHSLEGTLMAGRDLKFLSLSMTGCLCVGALVLMLVSSRAYGLAGCWCALVGFQWSRFFLALQRLLSPDGILYSEDLSRYKIEKQKAA
ncbi:protein DETOXIFICATION 46, chloroplastic isoform X3 [Manihot esculenta]|uniref:protein DETOXIFICATION 46, chloroplastic isoform X3 n=1 Tax=Manihot esculenta TaxID=3983 RepID=UPI001CC71AE6|nr:protein DETOXIFICATION 46, chloroplastic isoform X3 [Manihot esculenta]